jgi:DNA-binding CsgD family transcriptional regulator
MAAYALQRENELLAQRTLGVTVILFLLFTLAFYVSRLRAVQEKQRLQAERALAAEQALQLAKELEITNLEIAANKNRLADYARMLIERNNQINELSQKLELSAFAQTATPDNTFDLFQQVILTESDWELFQQRFNSVYPGYIAELRLRLPDLTPAEMRLVLLGKMGLSLKETAAILGISIDSVKKGRYRLKKKYSLEGDDILA